MKELLEAVVKKLKEVIKTFLKEIHKLKNYNIEYI